MWWMVLIACNSDKSDKPATDSAAPTDSGAPTSSTAGLVEFVSTTGEIHDLSAVAAAGSAGAPAELTLDEEGELRFSPGNWFVHLVVNASGTVSGRPGDDGALPALSGGGTGVVIEVLSPVTLVVQDLAIIDGYGCMGTAVRGAADCDIETDSPIAVDLTLRRVDIYGHRYEGGGGAVGLLTGSSLRLEDSNIHDNEGHGVFVMAADVSCVGKPGEQFGIWANGKNGIYALHGEQDQTIHGESCDFGGEAGSGGNGNYDVSFLDVMNQNYDDDATFTCSSAALACE